MGPEEIVDIVHDGIADFVANDRLLQINDDVVRFVTGLGEHLLRRFQPGAGGVRLGLCCQIHVLHPSKLQCQTSLLRTSLP